MAVSMDAKQIMRSLQGPDGKRVGLLREETYQTALKALRKAIRDDARQADRAAPRGKHAA